MKTVKVGSTYKGKNGAIVKCIVVRNDGSYNFHAKILMVPISIEDAYGNSGTCELTNINEFWTEI